MIEIQKLKDLKHVIRNALNEFNNKDTFELFVSLQRALDEIEYLIEHPL